MSIYVTQLSTVGYHGKNPSEALRVGSKFGHRWCLLFADGADSPELQVMAARLNLHIKWFDGDHYDIQPHVMQRAVKAGATALSDRAAAEIWRRQKAAARGRQ